MHLAIQTYKDIENLLIIFIQAEEEDKVSPWDRTIWFLYVFET